MVDITMCRDEECPWKEKCCRFTAKPGPRQSYFAPGSARRGDRCMFFDVNEEHALSCAECGKKLFGFAARKYYGDGAVRCHPECVRKYEKNLEERRDRGTGRFEKKGKV